MIRCDLKKNNCKCGCQTTSFKWISHKYKAIFFEIPKNASTSIKTILKSKGFKLYYDSINEYGDYFKFTFFRNPYDRVISNWKMFCSDSGKKISRDQLRVLFKNTNVNKLSFKNFVNKILLVNNHHWEQQTEFIKENDKIIKINFKGKMEILQADYIYICKILDMSIDSLNHINKTNHNKYRKYYDNEIKNIIDYKYINDLKYLDYGF